MGQPHGTSIMERRMQAGVAHKEAVGGGQWGLEAVLVMVGQDTLETEAAGTAAMGEIKRLGSVNLRSERF